MIEKVQDAIDKLEDAEKAVFEVRQMFKYNTPQYHIVDDIWENIGDGCETLKTNIMAFVEEKLRQP